MGEISDSIIDGEMCQQCGEYIGDAVGYPRYCSGCSRSNNQKEKFKDKKKTTTGKSALNGIKNYIKNKKGHGMMIVPILQDYCKANNIVFTNDESIATEIQKDFKKFVKWFNSVTK